VEAKNMITKGVAFAIVLFSSSFALADSSAIGTASTRGEIRVDGYAIRGTATLFDNTAVETSEFAATLRLNKGTEIKLGTGSSGTLFRDRLILSRGETQLTSASSFRLEANGLSILPSAPNTTGVVLLNADKNVEVEALKGDLRVMDSHGVLLAEVNPGTPLSFPAEPSAQGPPNSPPQTISDIGLVSVENGHYYLTSTLSGIKYEITGNGLAKYVGDKVVINATLISGTAAQPVSVAIKSIGLNGGGTVGTPTLGKVLIVGAVAGEAAAIAYVVTSASR
jgi:hypothetical protein